MRKNVRKNYVVNIVFGVIFLLLAVFILYIKLRTPEEERPLMKISGQDVTALEYQMVLEQYQTRVKGGYTTEQANDKDFWISEFDGRSPLKEVMELAEADLAHKKTVAAMAASRGVGETLDYESFEKSWQQENEGRSRKNDGGGVVYGLSSFPKETYYQYLYQEMESRLIESLKKDYDLTPEELEAEYKSRQEEYGYEISVDVLIAEAKAENPDLIQEVSAQMAAGVKVEDLKDTYPEVTFYELTMNSLDTQEGKSGVYSARWLTAASLQEGEISQPCSAGDNILVMKCLGREENGYLTLEEAKGVLESQVLTEKAQQEIEKETADAVTERNDKALRKAALAALQ